MQFSMLAIVKFIYSEKATKFCKISTVDLSYVVTVKSTVEISQYFVAFSEYKYGLYTSDKEHLLTESRKIEWIQHTYK